MSLEANIERIAVALETIAGKLNAVPLQGSAPPAAAEKTSKAKAEKVAEPPINDRAINEGDPDPSLEDDGPKVDPDDVTKEMVRKALMSYAEVSSQDAAKKLMAECGDGAKSLGMLDEDFYAPVYIAARERTAAAVAETED